MDGTVTEHPSRRPASSVPSFDVWAEARVAALLRFAYLVTGAQQAAEDAVQSALTRACERWARVARTDDPDTYVRRMIINAHISAWRKSGRHELTVPEMRDTAFTDPADTIVRDDAVWRVCAKLPPRQRAAVVLRFYEDLDYSEISHVLGVGEATVRSHVHRGLAALRNELSRQEDV